MEQGGSLYRARVKFTHQSKHYYFGLNELCRKSKYRSFLIKRGCNLCHLPSHGGLSENPYQLFTGRAECELFITDQISRASSSR